MRLLGHMPFSSGLQSVGLLLCLQGTRCPGVSMLVLEPWEVKSKTMPKLRSPSRMWERHSGNPSWGWVSTESHNMSWCTASDWAAVGAERTLAGEKHTVPHTTSWFDHVCLKLYIYIYTIVIYFISSTVY